MTDRLDEIRARTEAATPGPWRAYGNTVEQEKTGCHQVVGTEFTGGGYMAYERLTTKDEDATFIAHAREDIPYLLAEIERLRAALELGYRATESRNLLAAASDDWGTTPMLAEFHERAGEALWPEGGES